MPFEKYLCKIKRIQSDLSKTLKLLLISSQRLQTWDRLRTQLSRQEETQRQIQSKPHGEKEAEAGIERSTTPAGVAMGGIYKPRNTNDCWQPPEARRAGLGQGQSKASRKFLLLSQGGGGAFMSSWLLPTLLKTPALCLPVHHVQETNNNSKRSFSKVSTPPPKPGLDLLSSILNRLPFHAKLAIQDVWLTSPHYLGLS